MPSPPTFIILSTLLPATDIPSLLGRFVTRPDHPRAHWTAPDDLLKILGNDPFDVLPSVGNAITNNRASGEIAGAIPGLLSLVRRSTSSQSMDLEDVEISTYCLRHPYGAFQKLVKDEKINKDISDMFAAGEKVFMITSLKVVKGTIKHSIQTTTTGRFSATVPLSATATAFGIVVPLVVDPEASVQSERGISSSSSLTPLEAAIYAIEYYQIREPSAWTWRKKPVRIGDVYTPKRGDASYSLPSDTAGDVGVTAEPGGELFMSPNHLSVSDLEDDDLWDVHESDQETYIYPVEESGT
jgi:hypothetical protein